MEHLIVLAVDKAGKPIQTTASVLINGEKNGVVGYQMQLEKGYVEISVDLPKAETKEIELEDTSSRKPMKVKIKVIA